MKLDIDPSQCRFAVNVRVRWADTDAAGIAYNGAYLTYFEVARVEYYRTLLAWKLGCPWEDPRIQDGLFRDWDRGSFTLVSSSLNWRSPARVDDRLTLATRTCNLGRTSFEHQYVVTRARDGALVALGDTVQVCVDPKSLQPMPLPDTLRADLQDFEAALAEGKVPKVIRSA